MIAVSNQKIQATVVQADRAASTPKNQKIPFDVSGAMANISGIAAVQQADIAPAVGQLANAVAADAQETEHAHAIQQGVIKAQLDAMEEVSC